MRQGALERWLVGRRLWSGVGRCPEHRVGALTAGFQAEAEEGVWELRVDLGTDPITGKRKQLSRTFRGPARAADAALRDLVDQQAPSRSDWVGATFGRLLDEWLSPEIPQICVIFGFCVD